LPVEFRTFRLRPKAYELTGLDGNDIEPELPLESADDVATDEAAKNSDIRVSPGDMVSVRYADGKARTLRVHIVEDGTANGHDKILPTSPLGKAIMGLRIEDETDVDIGGRRRLVIVERIDRTA
jgi:transcription elongation GreA/GreB family factor